MHTKPKWYHKIEENFFLKHFIIKQALDNSELCINVDINKAFNHDNVSNALVQFFTRLESFPIYLFS